MILVYLDPGEGSVRLIHVGDERGGETSGVVEVYMGSEWVGVCTDDWSKEDSGVICWQLGYSTGTPTFTKWATALLCVEQYNNNGSGAND